MEENYSVANIIKSNGIVSLSKSLQLTQNQVAKATSKAMLLEASPTLKNCDKNSIVKFCFETARYDFIDDDSVYAVPYGNSIQVQIGYKGYIELCMRSGRYERINCVKVLDCDSILVDENTSDVYVKFETDYKKRKAGKTIGYYAFAILVGGHKMLTSFMFNEEAEDWGKTYSKTYNSTWGKNAHMFDKMAMKTSIKILCKSLPKNELVSSLTEIDQAVIHPNGIIDYADNPQTDNTKPNEDKKIIQQLPLETDDSKQEEFDKICDMVK